MYPAKAAEPIEVLLLESGSLQGKGQFWSCAYMGMPTVDIFNKMIRPFIEILQSLVSLRPL